MTKPRFFLKLTLGLLILGIALAAFFLTDRQPVPAYPATVYSDCAPWDGSAFTVQIQWDDEAVIDVSIWQSPEIKFAKTFVFPDNGDQIGNAILIHPTGLPEPLSGEVRFQSVSVGMPIAGRFRFTSERGGEFVGEFNAEWGSVLTLCG